MKIESKAYPIMAEILREINPFIYEACLSAVQAPLTDLSQIPYVFDQITIKYEPNSENSPVILAVIYKLFAPYKLHLRHARMTIGIRREVCKAMNWNNSTVCNYYGDILISYYKGKTWRAKIDDLAAEILLTLGEVQDP